MVFCIWFLCIEDFRLDDIRIRNGKNYQPNVGLAIPACYRNGGVRNIKTVTGLSGSGFTKYSWSMADTMCASSPEICIYISLRFI